MYDPNDPFAKEPEKFDESASFEDAERDLVELSDESFIERYKSSKKSYKALVEAIRHLEPARAAIEELVELNIDSELLENTELLIADFKALLEQMHMASYWEQER
jgi:hypothetical protein